MAKAKSPKKPKTPRPRQTVMPGAEEEYIPEVTASVISFIEARDRSKDAAEELKEARAALVDVMKQHRLTKYVTPERLVATYELKEKVLVKKPKGVVVSGNGEAE